MRQSHEHDPQKAKEVMAFLQSCGIDARFEDDFEQMINVFDDDNNSLFSVDTDEEWKELQKVAVKIARGSKEAHGSTGH